VTDAVRLEREKRKTARALARQAREDKALDILTSPNMIRLAMLSGIIAYSTYCARSPSNVGPVQSALAFALPGVGIPMIAADAGIKDKWALAAISAASVGYVTGQMVAGWNQAGVDWPHEVWASITPWKD
jgi:hypothetical protein